MAGFAANAAYGLLQLALAETTGPNLDQMILGRLGLYDRGGINVFGIVGGEDVYRTNALTLDPNHLGVMLIVPLLVLFPSTCGSSAAIACACPRRRAGLPRVRRADDALAQRTARARRRPPRARDPYRRLLLRPRFLVPAAPRARRPRRRRDSARASSETVFEARTQGGSSTQRHFEFYELVRPALEQHPFFGLGLNTFSSYYEFLTGRTNWGPHSFYVALLTETGSSGRRSSSRTSCTCSAGSACCAASADGSPLRRSRRRPCAAARLGLTAALLGTLARTSST